MRSWLTRTVMGLGLSLMSSLGAAQTDDPYVWMEDVSGARALTWVREQNTRSLTQLEALPRFADYRARAEAILTDPRRIAYGQIRGDRVDNFWQDQTSVRGIWRTTSQRAYLAGKPQWRTLLDLDKLAAAQGENWVWKGVTCLAPDHVRCLVSLSRGGKDAVDIFEFDIASGILRADGFRVAEAKTAITWVDANQVLIASDFGPGSLTTSGYPRMVKLWKRGTPLAQAEPIFLGARKDVGVSPITISRPEATYKLIRRAITFWTSELMHFTDDGDLVPSPLPLDAEFKDIVTGKLVAVLRSDWTFEGRTYRKGSVIAYAIDVFLRTQRAAIEQVYAPPPNIFVDDVMAARDTLYLTIMESVQHKVLALRPGFPSWETRDMGLASGASVRLMSASDRSNLALVNVESFLEPDRLMAIGTRAPRSVQSLPARFDATKFDVVQRFASSADGARVPYFIVRPKGAAGALPTLLYGYGGFEVSLLPEYPAPDVQFWLEDGGAYVVANIRGGGEFGPAWHQAALKANRQKTFDDFHAVAQDLIKAGLTTPAQLGISGRSNGGLLVGTAFTQRPDLYKAVLMGVPLADMRRYHKLLAGASWMDEYGDPDKPDEWRFIGRYSPLQNLRSGVRYPRIFLYTSTKDDRVHPAHARKMGARLAELRQPFFYYENIDGGHAGVANLKENAYRTALMLVYLNQELRPPFP